MTPTYLVQMPINIKANQYRRAFTLVEVMVGIVIISLFVLLAQANLYGLLRKNTFKSQANELVSTMQMAVRAAAESNRRYEVIIDLTEQTYLLRQITSAHLPSDVLEEEIIVEADLNDNCLIAYVKFDDNVETNEDFQTVKFRAGHAGWQAGGKIVLLDKDENEYSIVVNRINRTVELRQGDIQLLMPRDKDEMSF